MLLNITDKNEWHSFTDRVADYNIYQTFEWGELKKSQGWNIKRFLSKFNEEDFTIAQIMEYRFLNFLITWIPGGPLYSKGSNLRSYESFLQAIIKYYEKQRFLLRLNQQYRSIPIVNFLLEKHGFKRPSYRRTSGFTIYTDLNKFEEKLTKNWQRNYKRACIRNLEFDVYLDSSVFNEILKLNDETIRLKKIKGAPRFTNVIDLYKYFEGNIISFIVRYNNVPVSGRVILKYKTKAFDYIAGTSFEGRKIYASHFLVYKMFEWCTQNGIELFDFSGVSPSDEGVFNFKKGTGGELIQFVGEWEIHNSMLVKKIFNSYVYFKT